MSVSLKAKIALQPVVDVAHLMHGPIACEGNSWDNRHSASSHSQIYRTGFTTDINEPDVIYGGEKRLVKSIREIIKNTTRRRSLSIRPASPRWAFACCRASRAIAATTRSPARTEKCA